MKTLHEITQPLTRSQRKLPWFRDEPGRPPFAAGRYEIAPGNELLLRLSYYKNRKTHYESVSAEVYFFDLKIQEIASGIYESLGIKPEGFEWLNPVVPTPWMIRTTLGVEGIKKGPGIRDIAPDEGPMLVADCKELLANDAHLFLDDALVQANMCKFGHRDRVKHLAANGLNIGLGGLFDRYGNEIFFDWLNNGLSEVGRNLIQNELALMATQEAQPVAISQADYKRFLGFFLHNAFSPSMQ